MTKPQIIIATNNVKAPAGALVLDYRRKCIWRNGGRIFMEPMHFRFVAALIVAHPRPVLDDDMHEALYGDREDGGPEYAVMKVQASRAKRRGVLAQLGISNIKSSNHLIRIEFVEAEAARVAA